jgi:hypothetical protein
MVISSIEIPESEVCSDCNGRCIDRPDIYQCQLCGGTGLNTSDIIDDMNALTVASVHNVRSPNYQVAETVTTCWKCRKPTKVFCIMLPENHEVFETFYIGEDDDGTDSFYDPSVNGTPTKEWTGEQGRKVYYNIQSVAASVLEDLSIISDGKYRMDRYKCGSNDTLMNHCDLCGAKQNEKMLNKPSDSAALEHYAFSFIAHSVPSGPIHIRTINKSFAAHGNEWILYSGIIVEGRIS